MIFSQEQALRIHHLLQDAALVDADVRLTGSTYQLMFCPATGHIDIDAFAPPAREVGVNPITGAILHVPQPRFRERYGKLKEFAKAYSLPVLPGYPEIFGRQS